MAIYKDNEIEEYPLYGLDLIGKLIKDVPNYYYKDHLGSVRAIVNPDNELVSAQDYDQKGYLLKSRTFESDDSKFKFTGKERDEENKYDYFGARYYDARVGRWGQTEPYYNKSLSWTPYNYTFDNPINLLDFGGFFPYTFFVRTFIPASTAGFGSFRGDDRGFSTSMDVTSRISQKFTLDPSLGKMLGPTTWSDPTVRYSPYAIKRADPSSSLSDITISKSSSSTDIFSFKTTYSASDPLATEFASTVDIGNYFAISENLDLGILNVSQISSGDIFPALEAFVIDSKNNKVFIGVSPLTGTELDMYGTGNVDRINSDIQIQIDKNGNFLGVNYRGSAYTIEEWNSQFINRKAE